MTALPAAVPDTLPGTRVAERGRRFTAAYRGPLGPAEDCGHGHYSRPAAENCARYFWPEWLVQYERFMVEYERAIDAR